MKAPKTGMMLTLWLMSCPMIPHAWAASMTNVDASSDAPSSTAAVSSATSDVQTPPNVNDLFRYDSNVPLDVKEVGRKMVGDVTVRDITFVGVAAPVKAYLVQPAGSGPFAAILYVHWLGEPSSTNRTQFLNEAVALAPKGVVSLLIDTMWAQPGWYKNRVPEEDYTYSIRQVVDLRRAMDLLLSTPNVDAHRFAFVGHDFGAMYGTVMGAVDPRPKTYVLLAGTISFNDWYLYATQPRDLGAYKKQMAAIDPVALVGRIKNAPVFFQFANTDEYVSQESTLAFYKAANPRKLMATYNTDHSMKGKDVETDRLSWLTSELSLAK